MHEDNVPALLHVIVSEFEEVHVLGRVDFSGDGCADFGGVCVWDNIIRLLLGRVFAGGRSRRSRHCFSQSLFRTPEFVRPFFGFISFLFASSGFCCFSAASASLILAATWMI